MTTDAKSMSAAAAIGRALKEAPIIGHRLWVVLLLNLGGTGVQVLIPVLVQQTIDRYVGTQIANSAFGEIEMARRFEADSEMFRRAVKLLSEAANADELLSLATASPVVTDPEQEPSD